MVDIIQGADGNDAQIRLIITEAVRQANELHSQDDPLSKLSPMEKGIAAIITAIVLGMLAWTVNTTNDTAKKVAVIESQMDTIRASAGDGHRATEARQHEREFERRVSRLEAAHGLNISSD